MKKNNKAAQVIEMLKAGESVSFIKRMLAVSESYIYMLKKQLTEAVPEENDDDVVRPRVVGPHSVMRVTKAEAEAQLKKLIGGWRAEAEADNAVDDILNERATTYGRFVDVAEIAQEIKATIRIGDTNRSEELPADQIEALDMIASKMGRILGGDSNYVDSWIDIAGYATLVAERLQGKSR
jgi:hypothetical protein